jgi:hypothetical protein
MLSIPTMTPGSRPPPPGQLNWWIPVHDIRPENTMAFHPKYWIQPVRNSLRDFNYYKWLDDNRRKAAKQIKTGTRKQPQADEPIEPEPQIRIVREAGGIIIFSVAYMHSTVRNTLGHTRFNIDFRSVQLDDVIAKNGAPNIDSECTGTTLRDFLRADDLVRVPEEIAALYDDQQTTDGEHVYNPTALNVT